MCKMKNKGSADATIVTVLAELDNSSVNEEQKTAQKAFPLLLTDFGKSWAKHCSVARIPGGGMSSFAPVRSLSLLLTGSISGEEIWCVCFKYDRENLCVWRRQWKWSCRRPCRKWRQCLATCSGLWPVGGAHQWPHHLISAVTGLLVETVPSAWTNTPHVTPQVTLRLSFTKRRVVSVLMLTF